MMDATFTSVLRLYEQGESLKRISYRLNISETKVRKILITVGAYSTPVTEEIKTRLERGETPDQIAEAMGIGLKAVNANTPYTKGMYSQEYPSKNAIAIRRSRAKADGQGEQT